jgi:membrane carboxypeptidase/penicillin-binding protein PbpC
MLALVGVNNATQTARDLGITSPLKDCGLSLVLGGCEVTLLDHTTSYATLANQGIKNPATPILKIEDKTGNTLEEFVSKSTNVVNKQAVYELTNILSDNGARSYVFGVNNYLTLPNRPLACKTGTTNKWRDGWSMCFTPSIVVGAWVGNSNNKEMKVAADGARVAAPITNKFLKQALEGTPVEQFTRPEGISIVTVDATSGKLPTEFTPVTKDEVFASYALPKEYDNIHVGVKIDRISGLPANNLTPPENVELRLYSVFHSERPDNPAWEIPVREWAESKQFTLPPEGSIITNPAPTANTGEDPKVTIVSPVEGTVITQNIFAVEVATSSPAGVTRVDLLIDGQLVESKINAPYMFMVNQQLTDGPKTIAVHVVDKNGKTADQSVPVILAINGPINILSPSGGSVQTGQINLNAVSTLDFGELSFYANNILVETVPGIQNPNGSYTYSTTWKPTSSGTYKLYAKNGATSSEKTTFMYKKQ